MRIILDRSEIILSDWTSIKHYTIRVPFQAGYNWGRYTLNNDGKCIIHTGDDIRSSVYFYGILKKLEKIYTDIYQTRDLYKPIEEAKNHIDNFVIKYDKLLWFI